MTTAPVPTGATGLDGGPGPALLEAQGISVSFGGVRAVRDVSVTLRHGECLGVVGPNGSGKSTLLNAFSGIVEASGTVTVAGTPMRLGRPRVAYDQGICRVFQAPQTYESLSCLENVMMSSRNKRWSGFLGSMLGRPAMRNNERDRVERARSALTVCGIASRDDGPSATLTYGQRRLLDLARAVNAAPRILLLDEPSAGLNDAETRILGEILTNLKNRELGIVVVDHKIDFIDRLSSRVLVMEQGLAVADGPPGDIWKDQRVIDAYLGRAADSAQH